MTMSDERLELLVRYYRNDAESTVGATACELARELLAARKVVEAARRLTDGAVVMSDDGGQSIYYEASGGAEVVAAIDAYDDATGESE